MSGKIESWWKPENWPEATKWCGVWAAQRRSDFWLWEDFLEEYKVKLLIELGSYRGGFSLFLLCQCLNRGIEFFTVDLQLPEAAVGSLGNMLGLQRHYRETDLLVEGGSKWLIDTIKAVENHPLLLYCDNGNKPEEYMLYMPELYPGDFVVVHDWNAEISDEDVSWSYNEVEVLFEDRCNQEKSLTRFFRTV